MDTETTGLPKDSKAPMTDLENWPRVLQLAWSLTDQFGDVITNHEFLVKPDVWKVPDEPFWRDHGFTQERNKAEGKPIREVLTAFLADLEQANYLVAHNMAFDHPVLGCEMIRYGMKGKKVPKICTMEATVEFCAIPFHKGQREWLSKAEKKFKFPRLEELYLKLFNAEFTNKHQAGGDVAALRICFFELLERGLIKLDSLNS